MHAADEARAVAVGLIMANNGTETAGSPTSHNAQRNGQIVRPVLVAQRGTVGIPCAVRDLAAAVRAAASYLLVAAIVSRP